MSTVGTRASWHRSKRLDSRGTKLEYSEGRLMNKKERHNCPYCDDEIVFKDEVGNFWAKQHGIQDCMNIIKITKNAFRDALKQTQQELGARDEELFVAQQRIKALEGELAGRKFAHDLTSRVGMEGIEKMMSTLSLDQLLKESLGEPWPETGPVANAISFAKKKV